MHRRTAGINSNKNNEGRLNSNRLPKQMQPSRQKSTNNDLELTSSANLTEL